MKYYNVWTHEGMMAETYLASSKGEAIKMALEKNGTKSIFSEPTLAFEGYMVEHYTRKEYKPMAEIKVSGPYKNDPRKARRRYR